MQNSRSPVQIAIVGARGYSGMELARALIKHPVAQIAGVFAHESSFHLSEALLAPQLASVPTWKVANFSSHLNGLHTVFLATPAEVSVELAPIALGAGVNVIDLSGAHRATAHYGLQPFAMPASSQKPQLIANPGCYATAVALALLPLLKADLIDTEQIVIDAKSGTTGAGRKPDEALLFSEVDGECRPYKVGQHQHWPEIVQTAKTLTGKSIAPFFTTHLLPFRRGIVASIYLKAAAPTDSAALEQKISNAYADVYDHYEFVRFGSLSQPKNQALLNLKSVVGTPSTHISFHTDGDKIYVFSLLDNLLKGAASQALENFNALLDLPLTIGLSDLEGGQ